MKLLPLLLAAFGVLAGQMHAADAKKPNIIFILADDIGLPGFGCTGGIYKTPNIDALDGLRDDSTSTTPMTKKRKKKAAQ